MNYFDQRIEQALNIALHTQASPLSPPRLLAAVQHSVFPGGMRIRPKLTLAVAASCGDDRPGLSDAAAGAIELIHCASLVHDDLPDFDNAAIRRGKPSVQALFGAPLAILAGDALIILSYETLARGAATAPDRLAQLMLILSGGVGMRNGIVAGQAWECEPDVELAPYQRAKTGALFAAASALGAAAAGSFDERWRAVGETLGEAYQVADDLRDVLARPEEIGKPIGQDQRFGRPSAVAEFGMAGAVKQLKHLLGAVTAAIPDCPGKAALIQHIINEASRFLPDELARRAA